MKTNFEKQQHFLNRQQTLLDKILVKVKPEHHDSVTTELTRVSNDFIKLTDDEKDTLYNSHGSVSFVYDNLEELDPDLNINNVPIKFEVEDIMIDTITDSIDDENYSDLLDDILEFCTYDYRDYE